MLLAFSLFLVPSEPSAVEVTGMAPQIALVEQAARRGGWTQLCRGRAGEETVLRFALPAGVTGDGVLEALGGDDHFISGFRFFEAGEAIPPTCDREPTTSAGEPSTVLALGTEAVLTRQVEIARACGFRAAYIRSWRDGDIPGLGKVRADVKTLDAGEDIIPRYGPGMCYVQMRNRKP